MDAIRRMLAPRASVLREAVRRVVDGEAVVPGDLVLMEAGDKVPADLRLVKVHGLTIQEAILTGESIAVDKHTDPVATDSALGDRKCMAFSGTTVASGQGVGVVVATGAHTEIGRISDLLAGVEALTTPLVQQMAVFAKWLTVFILAVAGLLLGFGYLVLEHPFAELFMAVVGLSVAAIPEGLPAVLTITLAVGLQAMARRNAIVRRLPAIETLGSVSVICSDKTGTLTRNEMSVASVLGPRHLYRVDGTGYEPAGRFTSGGGAVTPPEHPPLEDLALAAVLCNDAELQNREGRWLVEGDPMEGALLAFAGRAGLDRGEIRGQWARTGVIPFDSSHRFMATLNHDHEGSGRVFVKGAPALKRADADIAMGRKGSEAAKEASELVLADDNFASITAAVREGRTVYANIKKVISWTLPTNAGEASTIILALLLGLTLPITPVQILWVNMMTAVTLGIVLAFEPSENDIMARPPRPRGEPLLSGDLIWHIVLVAALFLAGVFGIYLYAVEQGYSIDLARTIAMNTLVIMEIFHLLFIRNMYSPKLGWKRMRGTRVLWLAIVLVVVGQIAITYLPPMQGVFETESIPLRDALLILAVGVVLFVFIELEKRLRLRLSSAVRAPTGVAGNETTPTRY